jgi:HKD family nuclease
MTVVELIGATTTTTGLTIRCELDENFYDKGVKIGDEEMESLNITRNAFHPELNFSISPRATPAD